MNKKCDRSERVKELVIENFKVRNFMVYSNQNFKIYKCFTNETNKFSFQYKYRIIDDHDHYHCIITYELTYQTCTT